MRSLDPPAPVLQVFNYTLRRNNARSIYQMRSLDPPAPVLQVFNYTLRRNNARSIYQVRFLDPPAPVLQATVWFKDYNGSDLTCQIIWETHPIRSKNTTLYT